MRQFAGRYGLIIALILTLPFFFTSSTGQQAETQQALDEHIRQFLDEHRRQWRDSNVPMVDGQLLYDIILENGYKQALEIGTSTGHSAIWIAWALSKTGGKLITIEINERRHRTALENFNEAGLSQYIDARLADAHELVPELEGPFDFVFSDADKDWYTQYFIDIFPKLKIGGCFTAHNISGTGRSGSGAFLTYIQRQPNLETTVSRSGNGVSISYKLAE